MVDVALILNSAALCIGVTGALGLALLTDTPKINADGSISLSDAPSRHSAEEIRARNRKRAALKHWAIPMSYYGVALGFLVQLVALWLPMLWSTCQ